MLIRYILSTIVLLSLFFANAQLAHSANSILSTTVRKTGSDGLHVTFYTQNDNTETPIVKNKGNNQYVILLPNVTDAAGKQPDIRTASDIVSDVNLKTISEGAVTYTKVTLTTKRPVSVNAETRKTSQSVSELSGMNDIVAKVSLISDDIKSSKNAPPAAQKAQPTTAKTQPVSAKTVAAKPQKAPELPKMNNVQDVLKNKNLITSQKVESKPTPAVAVTKTKPVSTKTVSAHVPANTKTIKNETKKLQNENIKNVRNEAVKNIDKIEKNVKTAEEHNILVNEEEVILPPLNAQSVETTTPVQEIKNEFPTWKKFNAKKLLASPILLISLFILGALLVAISVLNKVKSALSDSQEINNSFISRMNTNVPPAKKDYSEIAQDKNMTWQEKYAIFKTGKAVERKREIDSHIGMEPDEDLDIVEEFVEEDLTTAFSFEDTPNPFASEYKEVHSSGDVIAHSMRRGLTSFEERPTLSTTRRNSGLKPRFKSFENSPAEGLNRDMKALLDAVIQVKEEKSTPVAQQPQHERIETVVETPSAPHRTPEIRANATSPIERAQAPAKKKMKIKESRAIDEHKGFYLVDMEDKLALMGRVNDKFTVLKKFDDKDKTTLQVRRDKDNLYMVRTDGFKALVDVEGSKMGVLAEL